MRICIFLFLVFVSQACDHRKIAQQEIVEIPEIYGGQERSSIIIVDTIPIYARLKVNLFSLDSMNAEVTFYNNSKRGILLYKPLLPSDSMESPFPVLDDNSRNLPDIRKKSDAKYLDNIRDTGG